MNCQCQAAALEAFLSTHRSALVSMLSRRIPRQLRAVIGPDDVAQEAALEAMRSAGEFRATDGDSMRRWVWQIARHRLCDLIKAQRRLKRTAAPDGGACCDTVALEHVAGDEGCPAAAAGDGESADALRGALAALPGPYREALRLRYFDGVDVPDAAARMGRTPAAFLMLCNRGLKRLRRDLSSHCDDRRPVPA